MGMDADDIVSLVVWIIGAIAATVMGIIWGILFKDEKRRRWEGLKDRLLNRGGYRVPMLQAVVGPEDYKEYIIRLIDENGESALLASSRREEENFNIHKMHQKMDSASATQTN